MKAPRAQHAVKDYQPGRSQDPNDYADPPTAGQHWMCPGCDKHHTNCPRNMDTYRCGCGWVSDRDGLLMAVPNG